MKILLAILVLFCAGKWLLKGLGKTCAAFFYFTLMLFALLLFSCLSMIGQG